MLLELVKPRYISSWDDHWSQHRTIAMWEESMLIEHLGREVKKCKNKSNFRREERWEKLKKRGGISLGCLAAFAPPASRARTKNLGHPSES